MYKIKINNHYYSGTFGAPTEGYLREPSDERGRPGAPLEFASVADAYDYLTRRDGMWWFGYCGDGEFSPVGEYICQHGQYSRPVATIVNARGRTTKAIIAECVAKERAHA